MHPAALPTQFAPAERASWEEIRAQARYFADFRLLQQFFDAVPNIFLILNKHRQIIFANKALLELVGLKDEDTVYGLRPGEVLNCIHAAEHEGGCGTTEFCKTCGAVQAILTSLRGRESIKECRISQDNGEALDLRVFATPLSIGKSRFTLFSIADIRHEKRRLALERIFFHDILNVAGGLWGFAGLLKDADPGELDTIADTIYNLAETLIEEINAQRDLLIAENNELTVKPTPIDSLSFLREVAGLYQKHQVAKGRHIQIDPAAAAVPFVSDATLLRRVVGNMVKNALEACTEGQTVTLGCRHYPNGIELWVHNPTFMPRSVQLQMFNRSFSTKGKGRGLGTYSMKLLTERYLQGAISFTTSQTEGTTFTARYPLALQTPA